MSSFMWTTDPDTARKEQLALENLVRVGADSVDVSTLHSGVVVGSAFDDDSGVAVAVGVLIDGRGGYSHETIEAEAAVDFPYIPGLLAFRVAPAICAMLDQVIDEVEFLVFDSQGIAHPRAIGLASHLGVLYNKPSAGVTRKNLFGRCVDPPAGRMASTPIEHPRTGKVIGYALSLGEDCEPCYVSPGHMLTPKGALTLVTQTAGSGTCFPRAVARAHAIANSRARAAGIGSQDRTFRDESIERG